MSIINGKTVVALPFILRNKNHQFSMDFLKGRWEL